MKIYKRIMAIIMAALMLISTTVFCPGLILAATEEEETEEDLFPPQLEIISENDEEYFYESFELKITAKDEKSGIDKIQYWITDDKEENNFTAGKKDALLEISDISIGCKDEYEGRIRVEVSDEINNSDFVKIHVLATDIAGNSSSREFHAFVSNAKAELRISFGDRTERNYYYKNNRYARLEISDREYMFSGEDNLKEAIQGSLTLNEKAFSTEEIENMLSFVGKSPSLDEKGRYTYSYILSFEKEGKYNFDYEQLYKNLAGNSTVEYVNYQENPEEFFIDKSQPQVIVRGGEYLWTRMLPTISFGNCFSNHLLEIDGGDSCDAESGIYEISYCKVNYLSKEGTGAKTKEELDRLYLEGAFSQIKPFVSIDEIWSAYVRVEDMAGNVSYGNTEGIISDISAVNIELRAESPNDHGLYRDDVKVEVELTEMMPAYLNSGLAAAEYKLWKYQVGTDLDRVDYDAIDAFAEEKILDFVQGRSNYQGFIIVDAKQANSNYTALSLRATDLAGNASVKTIQLKIDCTAPEIILSYDNNEAGANGYFSGKRTARIQIRERNFSENDVRINITNSKGLIPEISGWNTEGKGDSCLHTAEILYSAEGDYSFEISCIDLAGNEGGGPVIEDGTVNPFSFTIDMTSPEISLEFDNTMAVNEKYYQSARRASIKVIEHNFDSSRVQVNISASLSGSSLSLPQVSWIDEGDIHIGNVDFNSDGDYSIGIEIEDLAGNQGQSIPNQYFTIDSKIEKPRINGLEDKKSYRGDIEVNIEFNDPNYKEHEISVSRSGANIAGENITGQFFSDAEESAEGFKVTANKLVTSLENDGIYTIEIRVSDWAGNEESERINFIVNRFGSVYAFDDYLIGLQNQYVNMLENDLIIYEYNPDLLIDQAIKVEITRDGRQISNPQYAVRLMDEADNDNGWWEYRYVISKENFIEDGLYKIYISSEDYSGNRPENSNYKEKEISFRYDTTPPEMINVNGMEKSIVNANSLLVDFEMFDAMGLKKISVYNNDALVKEYSEFENIISFNDSFQIEAGQEQHIRVIAEDLAGNILDTDKKNDMGEYEFLPGFSFNRDITVSRDFFVRLFADQTALISLALGMAVFLNSLVIGMLLYKKKHL